MFSVLIAFFADKNKFNEKNIVLVTWIGNGNYGTSLQSFALHRKLEMLGYKVSFLQNFPNNFGLKYKVKNILRKLGIDTKKSKRR